MDVRTHARATALVLDGRRVSGVRYLAGDREPRVVTARRGVIVSAGVLGSPKLLQLSGIGDPALLGRLGMAVAHALPGVALPF